MPNRSSVWRFSIAFSEVRALPAFTRRRLSRRSHFKRRATRGSLPSMAGRFPSDVPDALFRAGNGRLPAHARVSLIEGRLLDARDGADAPLSVIINETLVRRLIPEQSVLGRRSDSAVRAVVHRVGVVRDVLERGYGQEAKPGVYVTPSQAGGRVCQAAKQIVVRVDGVRTLTRPPSNGSFKQVNQDQPTRLVRSMKEIALSVGDRQQRATLLVMFGASRCLIASLGLYGLLADGMARSREIGIRMALGATGRPCWPW